MPSKASVRFVKFSAEEMAYDSKPGQSAGWIPVGRGTRSVFAKPSKKMLAAWRKELLEDGSLARVDPDIRQVFPDDQSLNQALRKVIELRRIPTSRKKSA
jgi:hypothetical protein